MMIGLFCLLLETIVAAHHNKRTYKTNTCLLNISVSFKRSSQLRRLAIAYPGLKDGSLSKALEKLKFLEELSICPGWGYLQLDFEALGKYCPRLRTLELIDVNKYIGDEEVKAISVNLPELRQLKIIENLMLSNTGLQAILDGCRCLQVLDLRLCPDIDLTGDLGKRLEQIECVLHTEPYYYPYRAPGDFMDLETYKRALRCLFMHKFEIEMLHVSLICLSHMLNSRNSSFLDLRRCILYKLWWLNSNNLLILEEDESPKDQSESGTKKDILSSDTDVGFRVTLRNESIQSSSSVINAASSAIIRYDGCHNWEDRRSLHCVFGFYRFVYVLLKKVIRLALPVLLNLSHENLAQIAT
ncbi:putative F-box/LRR-repeat protein 23 [Tanacetum coccineum]|uniref:F-box/LRR-repeat protein 23 n=1 Tax=Tanacetum coccineum TaxID=301880 RepID=A0ABQ5CM60_9ASTR